jgi:hypothetical protein
LPEGKRHIRAVRVIRLVGTINFNSQTGFFYQYIRQHDQITSMDAAASDLW